ncbi:MAG: hypothetical protein ACI4M9_01245 [Succinivibrio sp.]
MYHSLGIADVVELVILCAVLFIPAGFLLKANLYRLKFFFKIAARFKTNLRDMGSFREFLESDSKRK